MKLNESQLRKLVKSTISEVRGSSYKNVTPDVAKDLFQQLSQYGRNRKLTYHDELQAQKWIDQNIQNWSTTTQAKRAMVDYLVKLHFGNYVDYM